MKVYKYWAVEKGTAVIRKQEVPIQCYGGSNASLEEARQRALEKLEKVRRKLAGSKNEFRDYEVEIREEILETLNENAVITRNRAGAHVLNARNLMILDIDQPPFSFSDLFKRRPAKVRILEKFAKTAADSKYAELGFRIYETCRGIRVIVLGKDFEAKSDDAQQILRDFRCDYLYVILCKKQDCFRARLTPKAYRMKMKGIKINCPLTPGEEEAAKRWLEGYECESKKYATCKFLTYAGRQFSENEIIQYHDRLSRAHDHLPLA